MSLLVITISEKQFVQLRDNVETVICHGLNGLETDLIWRNIVIGYSVVHFCQAIAFLWAFQHNFDTQICGGAIKISMSRLFALFICMDIPLFYYSLKTLMDTNIPSKCHPYYRLWVSCNSILTLITLLFFPYEKHYHFSRLKSRSFHVVQILQAQTYEVFSKLRQEFSTFDVSRKIQRT